MKDLKQDEKKFLYFICNSGYEKLLKEELRLFYPELHLAYSSGNFLTFKCMHSSSGAIENHPPIFAREYGHCLGKNESGEWIKRPIKKDPFSDVNLQMPEESPSRAWFKIHEALLACPLDFKAGQTVLELGCAPGGMSYALLSKGMNVIGVDTGTVDDICHQFKKAPFFKHIVKPVQDVVRFDIDHPIDWLVLDINLPPEQTLKELARILWIIDSDQFKGVILTLKMTKVWLLKKTPNDFKAIKEMNLDILMATHLPSNKQEFTVVATKIKNKNRE